MASRSETAGKRLVNLQKAERAGKHVTSKGTRTVRTKPTTTYDKVRQRFKKKKKSK